MRLRKPIWTEGLFITQHHFQQLDRYHETLLAMRLGALTSEDWGVLSMEIDERSLAAGQLRVVRLKAILPEGTPIHVGEAGDDLIPPRQIAFPASQSNLDVYVGISEERDVASNVELEGKAGSLSRYVREQGQVSDYNGGGAEHPIQWGRHNLRVVLGSEPREGFVGVRIARLARSASGEIVLKKDYVPPALQVSASPFLTSGFRRLLEVLASKQRTLASGRRARTEEAVEFAASDTAKFWLLHLINTAIPAFSHIVHRGAVQPEQAYLALAQLIGQLCTFAVDGDPTAIPAFSHVELGETFAPMFQRAAHLLDVVVAEKFVEIPLQKREDGMYLGQIDDRALLTHELFVVATGEGVPEATLRERLPKLSKVASWGHINSILNSAVNGAKLELEYRPPGALPMRRGGVYFRLTKTPDFWNDIAGTGTIALYQPIDPQVVNLSLFAVDPKNLK